MKELLTEICQLIGVLVAAAIILKLGFSLINLMPHNQNRVRPVWPSDEQIGAITVPIAAAAVLCFVFWAAVAGCRIEGESTQQQISANKEIELIKASRPVVSTNVTVHIEAR